MSQNAIRRQPEPQSFRPIGELHWPRCYATWLQGLEQDGPLRWRASAWRADALAACAAHRGDRTARIDDLTGGSRSSFLDAFTGRRRRRALGQAAEGQWSSLR